MHALREDETDRAIRVLERRDEHIEARARQGGQEDHEPLASERHAEAEPTTGQRSDATSTTRK